MDCQLYALNFIQLTSVCLGKGVWYAINLRLVVDRLLEISDTNKCLVVGFKEFAKPLRLKYWICKKLKRQNMNCLIGGSQIFSFQKYFIFAKEGIKPIKKVFGNYHYSIFPFSLLLFIWSENNIFSILEQKKLMNFVIIIQ